MSKWNVLDKIIAKLRYKEVYKYITDNKIVCDIGCGQEAKFLNNIMEKSKKCIGIDKYINNCDEEKLFLRNMDITKNIENLDYKVDIVTMLAVIEHISDAHILIENAYKILNKDGILIITTPTKIAKPLLEFLAFKMKIINEDEIREHKKYYDKVELKRIVEKNKFNIIKYKIFEFGFNQLIVCKK